MREALAVPGGGLHVSGVRIFPLLLTSSLLALTSGVGAGAQVVVPPPDAMPSPPPATIEPRGEAEEPEGDTLPDPLDDEDEIVIAPPAPDLPPAPDYSQLPPRAERAARLDVLFERLAVEEDTQSAELIAEEIWALWMDSGSASVNYLLVRADAAQKRGDTEEARRMIDLMTGIAPDHAEGWARSARLSLDEEDYSRTIEAATRALIEEPRHFYALWTLGNVLERLGRKEAALEVYEEAHALFPKLGGVKTRLDALRSDVLGDVL